MTGKLTLIILLVLGVASGCHRTEPATVRACVAVLSRSETLTKTPLETCRCSDEIAHRQLDPDAYRLATDLAEATLADRAMIEKGRSATNAVVTFHRRVGPVNSAIAAVDLSIITAKAAGRCF